MQLSSFPILCGIKMKAYLKKKNTQNPNTFQHFWTNILILSVLENQLYTPWATVFTWWYYLAYITDAITDE